MTATEFLADALAVLARYQPTAFSIEAHIKADALGERYRLQFVHPEYDAIGFPGWGTPSNKPEYALRDLEAHLSEYYKPV